eukprot:937991_1
MQQPVGICRVFLQTGVCPRGIRCKYEHISAKRDQFAQRSDRRPAQWDEHAGRRERSRSRSPPRREFVNVPRQIRLPPSPPYSNRRTVTRQPARRRLATSPTRRRLATSPTRRRQYTSPDRRRTFTSPDRRREFTSPTRRASIRAPAARVTEAGINPCFAYERQQECPHLSHCRYFHRGLDCISFIQTGSCQQESVCRLRHRQVVSGKGKGRVPEGNIVYQMVGSRGSRSAIDRSPQHRRPSPSVSPVRMRLEPPVSPVRMRLEPPVSPVRMRLEPHVPQPPARSDTYSPPSPAIRDSGSLGRQRSFSPPNLFDAPADLFDTPNNLFDDPPSMFDVPTTTRGNVSPSSSIRGQYSPPTESVSPPPPNVQRSKPPSLSHSPPSRTVELRAGGLLSVVSKSAGPSRMVRDASGPGRLVKDATGPGRTVLDATGPGRAVRDASGPGRTVHDASGRVVGSVSDRESSAAAKMWDAVPKNVSRPTAASQISKRRDDSSKNGTADQFERWMPASSRSPSQEQSSPPLGPEPPPSLASQSTQQDRADNLVTRPAAKMDASNDVKSIFMRGVQRSSNLLSLARSNSIDLVSLTRSPASFRSDCESGEIREGDDAFSMDSVDNFLEAEPRYPSEVHDTTMTMSPPKLHLGRSVTPPSTDLMAGSRSATPEPPRLLTTPPRSLVQKCKRESEEKENLQQIPAETCSDISPRNTIELASGVKRARSASRSPSLVRLMESKRPKIGEEKENLEQPEARAPSVSKDDESMVVELPGHSGQTEKKVEIQKSLPPAPVLPKSLAGFPVSRRLAGDKLFKIAESLGAVNADVEIPQCRRYVVSEEHNQVLLKMSVLSIFNKVS